MIPLFLIAVYPGKSRLNWSDGMTIIAIGAALTTIHNNIVDLRLDSMIT
jgi:hypothetical protein